MNTSLAINAYADCPSQIVFKICSLWRQSPFNLVGLHMHTWLHTTDGCGFVTMSTRPPSNDRHAHAVTVNFLCSPSIFLVQDCRLVPWEGC